MTMCSTSRMVPVRLCAGIASARSMLWGKAAAAAALLRNRRKVRRFVVSMNPHLLEMVEKRLGLELTIAGILDEHDVSGITARARIQYVCEARPLRLCAPRRRRRHAVATFR